MPNLAGIIYPTSFEVTGQIGELSKVFLNKPNFELFRYKNLELGLWDSKIPSNEQKTEWILFDGIIHNTAELKQELQQLGYRFESELMEEVILHAYDAWHEDCLKRLNGQFALVIFDGARETLLLARDRIGGRTLYWSNIGDDFIFSSQLKGILATGLVPGQPSGYALGAYLHFGYFPQDLSPIQGVNKLLPGYYLKVNLKRKYFIEQYWSLSQHTLHSEEMTFDYAATQCSDLLGKATSDALNTPSLIYLPNNTGAKTLATLASSLSSRSDLKTCLASSSEEELERGKKISDHYGLPFVGKKLEPTDLFDGFVNHIWNLDEPIGSFRSIRLRELSKLAAEEGKTLCLPHGWQELFAARPRHVLYGQKLTSTLGFMHRLAKSPPAFRDRILLPIMHTLGLKSRFKLLRHIDLNTALLSYLLDTAIFHDEGIHAASPYLHEQFDPAVFTQRFHRLADLPGDLNPSLYFDMKTDLPDNTLFQFEHLLEPVGGDWVFPYLDNRVVDFVNTIPDHLKFKPDMPGYLLQAALEKLDPNSPEGQVRGDPSMDLWKQEPNCRLIFSALKEGRLVEEGYLSAKWIEKQVKHPVLTQTAFDQLWTLLVLEVWFRLFITNPIGTLEPKEINLFEFLEVSASTLKK